MKQLLFPAIAFSLVIFTACNSGDTKKEHEGHDMSGTGKDTSQHASAIADKDTKVVTATFHNVDATVAAAIKQVVDHYLHIKNALAGDNPEEAANGGKAMVQAMSQIDKSLLTAEQRKLYDDNADDLKEHAAHIGENGGNMKHQREHFVGMSEDIYALVKGFGGGRTLYHDHCPMAQDNKGAMWISEMKEIKNPYFGAGMLTCGSVEEMIK